MADRTVGEERGEAAGHRSQRVIAAPSPRRRQTARRSDPRAARQEAVERVPGDEPAIEQRASPSRVRDDAELREHQRDVRLVAAPGRRRSRSVDRATRRRAAAPRSRRPSRSRDRVGLERELAQQRQAERVDGADGDVAEPIAQIAASAPGRARICSAAPRSSRMMRSRISAAALRVNVIARMLAGSTPALSRFT